MVKAKVKYGVRGGFAARSYDFPKAKQEKWAKRWKLDQKAIASIAKCYGTYVAERNHDKVLPADVKKSAMEGLNHCERLLYWLENKDWRTAGQMSLYDRPSDYREDILQEQLIDLGNVLRFTKREAELDMKGGSKGKGQLERLLAKQVKAALVTAGKRPSKSESGCFWQIMSDLLIEAKDRRKPTTFVNYAMKKEKPVPKKGTRKKESAVPI